MKYIYITTTLLAIIAESLFAFALISEKNEDALWPLIIWPIVFFHLFVMMIAIQYFLKNNQMGQFLSTLFPNNKNINSTIGKTHETVTKIIISIITVILCFTAIGIGIIYAKGLNQKETAPTKGAQQGVQENRSR